MDLSNPVDQICAMVKSWCHQAADDLTVLGRIELSHLTADDVIEIRAALERHKWRLRELESFAFQRSSQHLHPVYLHRGPGGVRQIRKAGQKA